MSDMGAHPGGTPIAIPRAPKSRVSAGWIVMLLAGLVAFLVFLVATRPKDSVQVAVAKDPIAAGTPFSSDLIEYRSMSLLPADAKSFITHADVNRLRRATAELSIESGDILTRRDFAPSVSNKTPRTMSIEVDPTRANGGKLDVGDKVDLIDIGNSPTFAATNLKIVAVNKGGRSGASLGIASTSFSITVEVTVPQSLAIASAIQGGKFEIIRSTGATPISSDDLAALAGGIGDTPTDQTTTTAAP